MPSLNKVMLMGNLTRDPELRYTPKGAAICDIGLAVNRKYKVENEMREEVTFMDVAFWGKAGETIAQYCKKGHPIYVEGRLQMDTWDDKQTGKKMYKMKITGEEFQFLNAKSDGGEPARKQPPDREFSRPPEGKTREYKLDPRKANGGRESLDPPGHDDEEDIPF